MFDEACRCGMTRCDFWSATHNEVMRYINAANKEQRTQLKLKAKFKHDHAKWVVKGMAGKTIPSLYTEYPELFPREDIKPQDWQESKRNLMRWVEANKQGGQAV